MRQFATGLNRTWLAIIGVLLLLAGLAGTSVGTGLLTKILSGSGSTIGPSTGDPAVGPAVSDVFASTGAVVGVGVVGLLLGLLALAWLRAQVPRTNAAAAFRLHDDPARGLTVCGPAVLTDAVSTDVQALPGVTDADAVLRGTATEPDLTVRLTVNDRTDLQSVLRLVQGRVVQDLQTAIGSPLSHFAIQVEVSPERRTADSVTL